MLGVEPETPRDLCCSCTIRCTRKAGDVEWVVRQSDPQHDCRLDKDPESVRRARARGARRLAALQQEEADFGIQGKPYTAEQDAEDSSEDEELDQLNSSDEEDEAAGVRRPRPPRLTAEGVVDAEDGEVEDSMAGAVDHDTFEESAPQKRARISLLVHPRFGLVKEEINRLAMVRLGSALPILC